jgi:GNAT superfamily N-acetyltransferase
MTRVTIRAAAKEDLPGLLALFSQPGIDDGETLSLDDAERLFDRILSYPRYRFYVALSDGLVVGAFGLLIMDKLRHRGAPSGVVEDVAVHPAWQGRGIGRQLMEFAMRLCGEAGCYKLTLSSNLKSTGAHAFYEKLGFEKHGFSYLIRLPAKV